MFGDNWPFVEREFATEAGPVDLLFLDENKKPVLVEVKRTAMLGDVDQVSRYVEGVVSQEGYEEARGMIAALDIRPHTRTLAEKRKIPWIVIPCDWSSSDSPS